jgi:hypothetical protein
MNNKKSRQALNDRFSAIIALLEESEEIVRSDREKGFSAVAEKILGDRRYGNLINKFLSGERLITYEQSERLCEAFDVSRDYMFKGEGLPFLEGRHRSLTGNVRILGHQRGNILFSDIEALASSAIDINVNETTERFSIPGFGGGDYVAFYISGNSMSPTIADGDMVICTAMEGIDRLADNEVYAIVTDNAVLVKRIQKVYTKNGRQLSKLKLISDNYLEHDPLLLEITQVRKIMKVVRKLAAL